MKIKWKLKYFKTVKWRLLELRELSDDSTPLEQLRRLQLVVGLTRATNMQDKLPHRAGVTYVIILF